MTMVTLNAPEGITARLHWEPRMPEHDRKRLVARQLVAERLGVEERSVRVERKAPQGFGFHTQLIAEVAGAEVPLVIRNANVRAATVVAVAEPSTVLGLDLRDSHPDEADVREMRRHSHLIDEDDIGKLLAHWTRVQAVRDADGRGTRVAGEHVRLDPALRRGWIPDRRTFYDLRDLSTDGWIITLAYAQRPA